MSEDDNYTIRMISIEQSKKIDPSLKDFSDEEIMEICTALYELGQIAFYTWYREKTDSKNPVWLFPNEINKNKLEQWKQQTKKQE